MADDDTTPDATEGSAGSPGNEGQGSEEQGAPDQPTADAPAPAAEEPAPAEPAAEEPAPAVAEETAAPDEPAPAAEEPAPAVAEEPAPAAAEAADEAPSEEPRRQRPPRRDDEEPSQEEAVVPGAHLEPDLVLEEKRPAEGEYADPYATPDDDSPIAEGEQAAGVEETPAPAARTPLELAADARYRATGKRKRAIARVILKPGEGTYIINGKALDAYFPRITLQKHARLPLETTGNDSRMDVVAKIHGGGVSAQATALRHGIARALVEADPNLRGELKRHGFLTRDARVKERKKAGLKKARKRPQFSKR